MPTDFKPSQRLASVKTRKKRCFHEESWKAWDQIRQLISQAMQTTRAAQSAKIYTFLTTRRVQGSSLWMIMSDLSCILFWNKIHNIFNTLVIQNSCRPLLCVHSLTVVFPCGAQFKSIHYSARWSLSPALRHTIHSNLESPVDPKHVFRLWEKNWSTSLAMLCPLPNKTTGLKCDS